MKFLLLSTYPEKGTRNSGDELLYKSLIHIMENVFSSNFEYDVKNITFENKINLDNLTNYDAIISPTSRPSIIEKDRFIQRDEYFYSALKNNIPIHIISAGWNYYPGNLKQSTNLKLDNSESLLYQKMFNFKRKPINTISTRDILTENLLITNNINCYGTTGDLAFYDTKHLFKPLDIKSRIDSIAVSMPHNVFHYDSAIKMALKLKDKFNCKVYVTFHGYHGIYEEQIKENWNGLGLTFVDLSGSADKLKFYDNIDVHIGFRLHGHIYFLRCRKPSMLIAEDGRGMGHLETLPVVGYSAAPKVALGVSNIIPTGVKKLNSIFRKLPVNLKAVDLFYEEMNNGYPKTRKSLEMIDNMWNTMMKPFVQQIEKK